MNYLNQSAEPRLQEVVFGLSDFGTGEMVAVGSAISFYYLHYQSGQRVARDVVYLVFDARTGQLIGHILQDYYDDRVAMPTSFI